MTGSILPPAAQLKRFERVTKAAQDNLGAVIDLVLLHNEEVVRGRQPRASLNRAIIVGSVSAWERFITDTINAFTYDKDDDGWGSGTDASKSGQQYPDSASGKLANDGVTSDPFLPRIHVSAAASWKGITLQRMEDLDGYTPGNKSGLTFSQHLRQWLELRNAIAHGSIRQLVHKIDDPGRGKPGDPYTTAAGGRYRLWASDATGGDPTKVGPQHLEGATFQAGCARGCLALVIQAIDWLIVDIGQSHGRAWNVEQLRLPEAWFATKLPPLFRGTTSDGKAHWTLWDGPELHRRKAA